MSAQMLPRIAHRDAICRALDCSPVVALLGPRQCGKTTLAHEVAAAGTNFFDLESSMDRQALAVAAEQTLSALRGLVVLDEIQTLPQLFPVLRVLADRRPAPAQFLILGSASPDLIRDASETLASRTLLDAQMRTDAQIKELNEAQKHTDEKLNALIDTVDRIIRQQNR